MPSQVHVKYADIVCSMLADYADRVPVEVTVSEGGDKVATVVRDCHGVRAIFPASRSAGEGRA